MRLSIYHYTGLIGRLRQLLTSAKESLKDAYATHKEKIAEYDRCLKYANERAEIYRGWAVAAGTEKGHWRKRALAAEAELFTIKINQN